MTSYDYVAAPNLYVTVDGRKIAWRSVGNGRDLVLCQRFRGTLDSWDPAFINALATQGFRVITFDYAGLGWSEGVPDYSPAVLADNLYSFIAALGLKNIVLGGWSLGGLAVQVYMARYPNTITHAVLLATAPPGPNVKGAEQEFYDRARKEHNDLEDEITLFFEPSSVSSRAAAKRSHDRIRLRAEGRSPDVPIEFARAVLGEKPRSPLFPADAVLAALEHSETPILHLGGDHDIAFPVENWYALNGRLRSLHIVTMPDAGHGPHHQYPMAAAAHIAAFALKTEQLA
ncbi:alpha/beta fold hydrolase [Paraburkholderia caribensis]|uniref:alpha/beta fold hydrolase n=1 Tax=Paraburkholderia caribensis TaxID=75105 RepID=UPI00078EB312|nr:alpha/beta hydrolase [Paraburkholderia caribensis]AMV44305.1 alpha/beta hydrolase [Paraburkholderia caribensis]